VTRVAMYCQKCQEFTAIDVRLASESSSMLSGRVAPRGSCHMEAEP
jgi:hypothetical protein